MNIKRPPFLFRLFAFLNRNIPAVQFSRKVLSRKFGVNFNQYIRDKGYIDRIRLTRNSKIFLWLNEHIDITIWWEGVYEKAPSLAFQTLLKKSNTVVDVGANIGYYSLLASEVVGLHGKVFSFEPVSKIFQRLLLNVSNRTNITSIQSACGQETGITKIYVGDDSHSSGSRISAPIEGESVVVEEVNIVRLDDYFKNQKIDAIKIDVEGYEIHVLKGMSGILQKNLDLKIFIEVSTKVLDIAGSNPGEIFDYLASFGLMPWQITQKNNRLKLMQKEKFWGNENLILFARKEFLPQEYISV